MACGLGPDLTEAEDACDEARRGRDPVVCEQLPTEEEEGQRQSGGDAKNRSRLKYLCMLFPLLGTLCLANSSAPELRCHPSWEYFPDSRCC